MSPRDPSLPAIRRALRQGDMIWAGELRGFLREAERIATSLRGVCLSNPERGAGVMEFFFLGCMAKIMETHDKDRKIEAFAATLIPPWIEARQRAGMPAAQTGAKLAEWLAAYWLCVGTGLQQGGIAAMNPDVEEAMSSDLLDRVAKGNDSPLGVLLGVYAALADADRSWLSRPARQTMPDGPPSQRPY